MSEANDSPVQDVEGAVETAESVETTDYMEQVCAEIARLEGELAERPADVALLTALMGAYRTVGNEERLWEVMWTLRDLPSKAAAAASRSTCCSCSCAWVSS